MEYILLSLIVFDALMVMIVVMLSGAVSHRRESYETDGR